MAIRSTQGRAAPNLSALPPLVLWVAAFLILAFGWGPNILLAVLSVAVLIFGSFFLWRPSENPILIFVFLFQWIESSIMIFHANFLGQHINQLSELGANASLSSVLSLLGLLSVALGVRCAIGTSDARMNFLARVQSQQKSQSTFLALHISVSILAILIKEIGQIVPGLSQPILALASIKWATYTIFTYATFISPKSNYHIWIAIFIIELFISLGGFFSGFKFVFIYSLIGIVAAQARLTTNRVLIILSLCVTALFMGVVWSAIKLEYRTYISGGRASQEIIVPYSQQITKIFELSSQLDSSNLQYGFETLLRRLSYVEYFGAVVNYVPDVKDHENGSLWSDSFTRPFMPRIVFPNKPVINESKLTNKFTGLNVAGFEKGTQISIGFIGETYIDFGPIVMMIVLFVLGFSLGTIYKWLAFGRYSRGLLGLGLTGPVFMPLTTIGLSSAKLVGWIVVYALMAWLVTRFVVPTFAPWLQSKT